MASYHEPDSDYKLPLRPWLEKQIRTGKFKGLNWDASSTPTEKRFRLPWAKKDYPGWEECYAIAKAWAEHQGREVSESGDDFSKLKANFRCNLNKSDDFEEIQSMSELDNQTGNFKMYRFVPPEVLRDRKKSAKANRAKRRRLDTNPLTIPEHSFDPHDVKTVSAKDLDCLGEIAYNTIVSSPKPQENLNLPDFLLEEVVLDERNTMDIASDSGAHHLNHGPQINMQMGISETDALMQVLTRPIVPQSTAYSFSDRNDDPASENLTQKLSAPQGDLSPSACMCECTSPMPGHACHTSPVSDAKQSMSIEANHSSNAATILDQLRNVGVKDNDLSQCTLNITYNNDNVFKKTLSLTDGCIIFRGNPEFQKEQLVKMEQATDERLADYAGENIQLPDPPLHARKELKEAIRCAELGIVVRYNPRTLCISVKRLCQSQVFYFDPHSKDSLEEPKKIERNATVDVFSYEKFVLNFMRHCVEYPNKRFPWTSLWLAIGNRPRNMEEIHTKKGIKIELSPAVLDFLCRESESSTSSVSLYFSRAMSVDHLLHQFDETSLCS